MHHVTFHWKHSFFRLRDSKRRFQNQEQLRIYDLRVKDLEDQGIATLMRLMRLILEPILRRHR